MEKLQRFSIRKLSIGAVSCLIGTVSFLSYSHKVQAAETPQTVETAKAENEIQPEKAQESKLNKEVKGDTQNAAVDKDVAGSQKTDALTKVNQIIPKENAFAANKAAVINKAETDASPKPVQTVSPKQPANATDAQPASDQSESAAANINALENNGRAALAPTALPKQPANADTQLAATTSRMQPFLNLAVESDNNDLTPKHETVDSTWTLHYVNQADHKQELKAPTVITMQYTRTNTPQSDGKIQYGDWSYVPGSFKQTGTQITVNDSDNPVKQDDIDKNGENFDIFTITAMYPTVAGYDFHDGVNGTRLHDNLRNNERQADSMNKDFYVEYDVAKPTRETVGSQWRIHYIDSSRAFPIG